MSSASMAGRKLPYWADTTRVTGWLPLDGRLVEATGWVVAMADVCGFGHDEDIICRALAHGRTEAEAIRNYWATADAQ